MKISGLLLILVLALCACSQSDYLYRDQQLLPVQEYERLIVGRLDADYVGDENCLAKCHTHDQINLDFKGSVHGEQIAQGTGLPLVNCETCHGPGSLAIKHLADVEKAGPTDRCQHETLLQLNELPVQAQSLICLKCHSAASTPTLNNWNASNHAMADIGCYSCHNLHQGPQQKVGRHEMDELCYACHQSIRMEFMQFSRHPVLEHKMVCIDCHNTHGTDLEHDLTGATVKEVCTRCHMEMQGPFAFEHADLTEDCTNCHSPHGSPNDQLLKTSQPFLCLQCHAGHNSQVLAPSMADETFKQAFYTQCTDCHAAIHGTDIPSSKGRGTFIAR